MNQPNTVSIARWTPDCHGKWDYDGPILSVSSRYWPPKTSVGETAHTASSVLVLHTGPKDEDGSIGDHIQFGSSSFTGDTEADVKSHVEAWVQKYFDRILRFVARLRQDEQTQSPTVEESRTTTQVNHLSDLLRRIGDGLYNRYKASGYKDLEAEDIAFDLSFAQETAEVMEATIHAAEYLRLLDAEAPLSDDWVGIADRANTATPGEWIKSLLLPEVVAPTPVGHPRFGVAPYCTLVSDEDYPRRQADLDFVAFANPERMTRLLTEHIALHAEVVQLRKEAAETRNAALEEAATKVSGGRYSGDYYSSSTDAQNEVIRWAETVIRRLKTRAEAQIETAVRPDGQ